MIKSKLVNGAVHSKASKTTPPPHNSSSCDVPHHRPPDREDSSVVAPPLPPASGDSSQPPESTGPGRRAQLQHPVLSPVGRPPNTTTTGPRWPSPSPSPSPHADPGRPRRRAGPFGGIRHGSSRTRLTKKTRPRPFRAGKESGRTRHAHRQSPQHRGSRAEVGVLRTFRAAGGGSLVGKIGGSGWGRGRRLQPGETGLGFFHLSACYQSDWLVALCGGVSCAFPFAVLGVPVSSALLSSAIACCCCLSFVVYSSLSACPLFFSACGVLKRGTTSERRARTGGGANQEAHHSLVTHSAPSCFLCFFFKVSIFFATVLGGNLEESRGGRRGKEGSSSVSGCGGGEPVVSLFLPAKLRALWKQLIIT